MTVRAPGHLLTHWRAQRGPLAVCGAGVGLVLRPCAGPVTCPECLGRTA